MALFLGGRKEWILRPVRQILPYFSSGFQSLVLARKPSSSEIADAILGNQYIWDALMDGGCFIWTPSRFLLTLSAAGLEAS